MASITIRNLEDRLKTRLRVRAAEHGLSMEEEARRILRDALDRERPRSLADLALKLFGPEHGVDLEPHPPVRGPSPPDFGRK
jgi:plasmid stability protein